MFHLLSKLLLVFIYPLTWAITLILIALFTKKQSVKRPLLISSVAVLWLFSNNYLLNSFADIWDIRSYPPSEKTYSCAILLGGFGSKGPGNGGHFNGSADRFIQGVKLIYQKKASTILISGGNGSIFKNTFIEANFVSVELQKLHIPGSVIIIENKSRNTLENAQYSKQLLLQKNLPPPYLVITSAFHMRRALATFKAAQVEVIPYPSDYKTNFSEVQYDDFLPNAEALNIWAFYIKEVIGYVVYALMS